MLGCNSKAIRSVMNRALTRMSPNPYADAGTMPRHVARMPSKKTFVFMIPVFARQVLSEVCIAKIEE